MSRTVEITGNQLTNALRALDVNFILGGKSKNESLHKRPARRIAALAQSEESRLRLSLIPLFLEHPEFALRVRTVAKRLDPSAPHSSLFNAITVQRSGLPKSINRKVHPCLIISRKT